MRLASLLRTPPPPHVFAVTEDQLLYGRLTRQRDALARIEGVSLHVDWFQLGPVGLLQIDRATLSAALATLSSRFESAPRHACLVVPNSWLRSLVVDVGSLPRNRLEATEVVRWRLKKLLPCRPEEVRLDFVGAGEEGKVLVLLGLDRPLAAVEECFATAGIAVGRLEPAALTLAGMLPGDSPALLAMLEERAVALVLVRDGRVLLVRHKPLPLDAQRAAAMVERELARTLIHARELGGGAEHLGLWIAGLDPDSDERLRSWLESAGGTAVRTLPTAQLPVVPGVQPVRLATLLATGQGGVA